MPKNENKTSESLHELEKLAKTIIRKNLKDNTLNYTIQFSRSNLEPGVTKYSAYIESPNKHVQPITYVFDNYDTLKKMLEGSVDTIDRKSVELAFLEDRINHHGNIKQAYEERKVLLEAGVEPEDEDIEMEEV